MALGYTDEKNGKLYARKASIEKTIENAGIKPIRHGGESYLSEEILYDFMLEVKTDK